MTEPLRRRAFLANLWKGGAMLLGGAAAWTGWDLLRPSVSTGFGGKIKGAAADAVPETEVVEVPAARAYLVRVQGEVVALSWKCTHLGCRVPFCASSGRFECPCHGSVFNRAGEYLAGPAPRGLDRYPVEIGADGIVTIDTATTTDGPPPGTATINEPASGPSCAKEG